MTYFDLFDIPVQLLVNRSKLPLKYFELSRKYHPDYYVNESPETQAEALERSAMLNRAFRTFQNPDETIRYVLQLKGLIEEEEKYELPPDFLMEVLEINETLMEGDDEGIKEKANQAVSRLEAEIFDAVSGIIQNYREGVTTEKELLQVKEYYYKKKYIANIRRQLL